MRRFVFSIAAIALTFGCRHSSYVGTNQTWGGQEGEPADGGGSVDDPDDDDELTNDPDTDTGDTDADTDTAEPQASCDDEPPLTLFVSPDDSNSQASPVIARETVLGGSDPYGTIRPWEFLNYYDFPYAAAAPNALRVVPTLVRDPASPSDHFVLQIGIASPSVANSQRAPMNLTFAIDTSGSMSGDPLDLVRTVGHDIARNLRAGDKVAIVQWSSNQTVLLDAHVVSGPDDAVVTSAFDNVEADGGTDLSAGLRRGYELAQGMYDPDRINRVVLLSDGGANLGETDAEVIGSHAGTAEADGIYMVGVGVGSAFSYNDTLMDAVTDLGKGAAIFVPSEAESERMFGERFVENFDVAARNVRVRLDLPPGFEVVRFSGEEMSTDASEIEPQHLAPNDTMVLQQTLASCAPPSDDARVRVTVTWQEPGTFASRQEAVDLTIGELLGAGGRAATEKATAILAYADALVDPELVDEAEAALATAKTSNPNDRDLAEIERVLDQR